MDQERGLTTVWVWGDQLDQRLAHLRGRDPGRTRILMVVSDRKLGERRWHRQKVHLLVTAMRRFAAHLENEGYAVDLRRAPSMQAGLAAHVDVFDPSEVVAMEPASRTGTSTLEGLGVRLVDNDHFLCHWREFSAFRAERGRTTMEDFYRWRRRRTGWLMEGDEPVGGRWNLDTANRQPPDALLAPTAAADPPVVDPQDGIDTTLSDWLPEDLALFGAEHDGTWATSREGALARLERFTTRVLPRFGDHQDAMVTGAWHLNHSLLSHALNLGLLNPREVIEAVVAAYHAGDGRVPLASAEGFLRQVLGWREFVYHVDRTRGAALEAANELGHDAPVPEAFWSGRTRMACLADAWQGLHEHGWNHHIERLMVFGNLALSLGTDPRELTAWFTSHYVDALAWVMVPNVMGMSQYADAGGFTSKPYLSGGAYLNKMGDHCRRCPFEPGRRTGPEACPFTVGYWSFIDRHQARFERHPRMAVAVKAWRARPAAEQAAVRARAAELHAALP